MTASGRDSHRPTVTVAILNYNGRRLLDVVLPSLAAQRYRDFETVVVDDCSTDDSLAYLHEQHPEVRVVGTGTANVGVAAALNIAVRSARSELVALLNNDIELDPDWLGELVAALERYPEASSASCKLLNYWRRGELDGAGDIFTSAGIAGRRGHGELDRGQYDRDECVFAPTAGAALYRASGACRRGTVRRVLLRLLRGRRLGDARAAARPPLPLCAECGRLPHGQRHHWGRARPQYLLLLRRNLLVLLLKDLPIELPPQERAEDCLGSVASPRSQRSGRGLSGAYASAGGSAARRTSLAARS